MEPEIGGLSPEEFWTTYYPKLYVYAASFNALNDSDLRSDCVRDLLLRLYERRGSYDPRFALSTWVYRARQSVGRALGNEAGRPKGVAVEGEAAQ